MPSEALPLYFYALWAINGPMDRARLCYQLEEFQRLGLDGVVFHPRFYPGKPPYLSDEYLRILDETILRAKALGLRFWIYDENGWPSGTADGQLYARHPQDICQRLDLVKEPAGPVLASFEKDGQTWHLTVQDVRGIDCFNPEATRHFLAAIHERYREGLSAAAFDHVEAFFTDEPESGVSWEPAPLHAAVPWSRHMPEFLRERFSRDVTAQLPLLFAPGEGDREFREAYWELITDRFCQGFLDPYRAWCEQHGKLFVGHVKGEEHPLFQVPMVGSCQRAYRHFSIPGIDALERFPSGHFFPRQASSVAQQFGSGRCMVEANGGSGWGSSPEDLHRYLVWLGRHGLTDFVLHLSQYQLDSPSLYDWPPSQPLHISWREAYPEILRRVRQEVGAAALAPRDTLVVAPYRGIMGAYEPWELGQTNIHNGADYPLTVAGKINHQFLDLIEELHAHQVSYDVTDERTFEDDAVAKGGLIHLGSQQYKHVVLSPGARLSEKAGAVLEQNRPPSAVVDEIAMKPAAKEVSRAELSWSKIAVDENAFLLEPRPVGEGIFSATFSTPERLPANARLSLVFADLAREVSINGKPLAVAGETDGMRVEIPVNLLQPANEILFRIHADSFLPFAWLTGMFLVLSDDGYVMGSHSTLRTEGPLKLVPFSPLSAKSELVQAGLPFAFKPVEAEVAISVPALTRKLELEFSSAKPDAICISDRQGVLGWTWGPEWALELKRELTPGEHHLQFKCVPSSYNYYGPHHYYLGDGHVVSPDQIRGVRNFADPPDAPAKTHVTAYHFRPWSLPSHVRFP